jgi:hypothetical protein
MAQIKNNVTPTDELKELKQSSMQRALTSGTLDDMEKTASIWKMAAEREKAAVDANNQARVLRLQQFQSMATGLVPFLSLLTVAITVWVQSAQVTATRQANEDTQWRDAMKAISTSASRRGSPIESIVANTSLKPFFSSLRYGRPARELALQLLGQTASLGSFEDLFHSAIPRPAWDNVDDLVKVNRTLFSGFNQVDAQLDETNAREAQEQQTAGVGAARQTPPSSAIGALAKDEIIFHRNELIDELIFVSSKIADILHSPKPTGQKLNFSKAFLFNCDLSNTDLSGADLSDARLEGVDLGGAKLDIKIYQFDSTSWSDTQWWKAAYISGPLLKYLSENKYPYYATDLTYDVNKEEYMADLHKLCGAAKLDCPVSPKFGTKGNADPGQ